MSFQVKESVQNMEADLVIIGGGGAGLAAALTASEKGCNKIIVLEKVGSTGGNSAMAHDLFGAESPVQKRMGSDARRDEFFKVAMRWSHWSKVNPRVIRAFIDKSGDTVGWLLKKGINFNLGQFYLNQSPRIRHAIEGRGAELMRVLAKECKERGIQILTLTPVKKLLLGKDGQITGVIAAGTDIEYHITSKSVIIASGGYAANKELLAKYCSYFIPDVMVNQGVRHNTGDGIQLATEVGAATAGLGCIMFHGPHSPSWPQATARIPLNTNPDNEIQVDLSKLVWEPNTLWVNKRGKRFIDEAYNLSSFAHAAATAQQPGGIMFSLFDDSIIKVMETEGLIRPAAYGGIKTMKTSVLALTPLPGLAAGLRTLAAKYDSWLKIADTWDDIANWIGAKPETFKKTIEEYNIACERGLDSILCKDRIYLLPLKSPPYYAIKGQSMICDAIGGAKINENMEVVDVEDNSIPGLFAAGSASGGWESENYCYELTGHLLGFALNSGRIAGENAVKYISKYS